MSDPVIHDCCYLDPDLDMPFMTATTTATCDCCLYLYIRGHLDASVYLVSLLLLGLDV
jgi:hypothetical protein